MTKAMFFGSKPNKLCPKSKINVKIVSGIVFGIQNDFLDNRIRFEGFMKKKFE